MARVLVSMGITKIRLTGGEPLLRRGVVEFVRELSRLKPPGLKPLSSSVPSGTAKAVPSRVSPKGAAHLQTAAVPSGADSDKNFGDGERLDIAMTTNGHLLADLAQPLK